MKLQIDTSLKTIKVEHLTNFGDLITALAGMFPDGQWREYSLDPGIIINWKDPYVIKTPASNPHQQFPFQPFQPSVQPLLTPYPVITYGNSGTGNGQYSNHLTNQNSQNLYNIEIKPIPDAT